MTIQFKKAIRDGVSLLIGISGPSGGGKTFTALQIATGLCPEGKRIRGIDTEAGRMLHYADQFDFDHAEITAPFSPEAYLDAIQSADSPDTGVIVIDSASHEWSGDGGIHDIQEEKLQKMSGGDYAKAMKMSVLSWKEPKKRHKRFMSHVLQTRAHVIFCLRAEEKLKIEKGGKVVSSSDRPLNERWEPDCEKNFMYEMTASILVLPGAPGVPFHVKVQKQHKHAFPENQQVSQEAGRLLAEWSSGGTDNKSEQKQKTEQQSGLNVEALKKETEGIENMDHLLTWWKSLTPQAKELLADHKDAVKAKFT